MGVAAHELYRAYVEKKLANQALDYDDLLLYWHAMMGDERLAAEIGGEFDHILVDEYQDTNVLQAEILKSLRRNGDGVTVVGDDAQAIYSFRAATVDNILGFPEQYVPRERPACVGHHARRQLPFDAARARCGERADCRRHAAVPQGAADDQGRRASAATTSPSPTTRRRPNTSSRACSQTRESGVPLKRQAVLFRSSHHSDTLELELTRRNIPFVKYGGLKFLEAAHVKDLLAVLRWADNPKNRIAAFRALQLLPGMGPVDRGAVRRAIRALRLFVERVRGDFARPRGIAEAWAPFAELMVGLAVTEGPWQGQVGADARVVRAAPRAHLRLGARALRRSRAARAPRPAVRDARSVSGGARARSAGGDRRSLGHAVPRRGLSDPVDRPFGEGTGMGRRVHPERRGRKFPVRVLHGPVRSNRGRAAPALCRDDAREERSAPRSRRSSITSPTSRRTATATSTARAAGS